MIISSTDQFHRSLWAQISGGGGRRQQTVCYLYDGPPESFPFQIVVKSRQLRTDHAATDPPTHILLFLERKQNSSPPREICMYPHPISDKVTDATRLFSANRAPKKVRT